MTVHSADELEAMAAALEASGAYRVLRRLQPRKGSPALAETPIRQGLFVEVETTGLDPTRCEIIEFAMTPFTYGLDGQVYSVGASFHQLREPSHPIPPEVAAITGLTDEMVRGRAIDPADVARFAAPAALVIAHNAAFDRRFLERFCDVFTTKPWACSMTQVDWAAEGFEGVKLAYLASGTGFFYDKHRAVHDCHAAVELLSRALPRSGVPALRQLLEQARRPSWRIWAQNSPFDLKDALKGRGYRWNGDGAGSPRAWYVDVSGADREAELAWLQAEIYRGEVELLVRQIDAHDRFSDRC